MKKIKFKSFKKKSGSLVAFSIKDSFPINVKRIFIINGKKNFTRGEHAHKKCSQFLFPILGKIKIECISNKFQKKLILNSTKNEGYLVKPKTWLRIKFLTKDSILMVACDKEYDFNDYIEKFSEFLRIIKKNNT
jgi:dTDP-4-dehydrorhamnose 3,5-epimerase-like enzyme